MELLCDFSKPKAVMRISSPHSLGPSPGNCLLFVTSCVFFDPLAIILQLGELSGELLIVALGAHHFLASVP